MSGIRFFERKERLRITFNQVLFPGTFGPELTQA
jgi:hypothetical protein